MLAPATGPYEAIPTCTWKPRSRSGARWPDGGESLGVPTWVYVDEPTTGFATHIAKYFTNSIREDGLLAIARSGRRVRTGWRGHRAGDLHRHRAEQPDAVRRAQSDGVLRSRLLRDATHPELLAAARRQAAAFGWSDLVAVCDDARRGRGVHRSARPRRERAGRRRTPARSPRRLTHAGSPSSVRPPRSRRSAKRSPASAPSSSPGRVPRGGRRRSRHRRAARPGRAAGRRRRRPDRRARHPVRDDRSARPTRSRSGLPRRAPWPAGSGSTTRSQTSPHSSRRAARSIASRSRGRHALPARRPRADAAERRSAKVPRACSRIKTAPRAAVDDRARRDWRGHLGPARTRDRAQPRRGSTIPACSARSTAARPTSRCGCCARSASLRRDARSRRAADQPRPAVAGSRHRRRGGGFALEYAAPLPVEGWNAQISLLAGMEAARIMIDAGAGIVRTLPPPPAVAARAAAAHAPGRSASRGRTTRPGRASCAGSIAPIPTTPRSSSRPRTCCAAPATPSSTRPTPRHRPSVPIHAGVAAPYAHVTAPLRRLADRYANEIVLAHCAGVAAARVGARGARRARRRRCSVATNTTPRSSARSSTRWSARCWRRASVSGSRASSSTRTRTASSSSCTSRRSSRRWPRAAALGDTVAVTLVAVDPVARKVQLAPDPARPPE